MDKRSVDFEDKELLVRVKSGRADMDELIQSDSADRFIKYVIKTYTKSPEKFMQFNRVEFEDLMQLGRIGLYKGLVDTDMDKEGKEIVKYLYMRVMGEIREVARSNDSNQLVISQRIRGMYAKYLQYHALYFEENQKDPSMEEVMNKFNISREDAFDLIYGMQGVVSDAVSTEDGEYSLMDLVYFKLFNSGGFEESLVEKIMMEERLALLNVKQRRVIELKYFHGYKNTEIATFLGCANSMVGKHLKKAFETLKLAEV